MTATPFQVDDAHRHALLTVAEDAIRSALLDGSRFVRWVDTIHDSVLRTHAASFVTLERGPLLLGCVGTLEACAPLAVGVAHQALGAAFADPRLPAIDVQDFVAMTVKVSVLSELTELPAGSVDELLASVRAGIDGVVVDAPRGRATLLPSVWRQLPEPDEFLAALWEKAGLPPGAWPAGTRALRYTTDEFARPGPRTLAFAS